MWVSALNWIINLIALATKILRVCTIYYTPKWWYPPSNLRPTPLGTENVKVQAFLFKRLKPEIILIVAQNHDQTLLATFCLFTIPCVEWCPTDPRVLLAKSLNFFAKKINVLFCAWNEKKHNFWRLMDREDDAIWFERNVAHILNIQSDQKSNTSR